MRLILFCLALMPLPVLAACDRLDSWVSQAWPETDFTQCSVDLSEIQSGGPGRDGIPSIDRPTFTPVADSALDENEPVIGLEINGDARAYPLRILTWHEIVNDRVGGQPIAVTYCPLCNASIVFSAVFNDQVLQFGVSGLLRNSDMIMYDRQTNSWWQQYTGQGIAGYYSDQALDVIPSRLESLGEFKSRHPTGQILIPNDPSARNYGANPYIGYDTGRLPFLYRGDFPDDVAPMERVVLAGQHAVTLARLRQNSPVTIEGMTFHWRSGQRSALDQPDISASRDVGTAWVTIDGELVEHKSTFAFVVHAFEGDQVRYWKTE